MPIEITCGGCQQSYSVPDSYAGKRVKCPKCKHAFAVPADPNAPDNLKDQWRIRASDGQGYGPITRAELDQWVQEGRLDENSQVLQDGKTQWQWASELYPQLSSSASETPRAAGAEPASPESGPISGASDFFDAAAGASAVSNIGGGATASGAGGSSYAYSATAFSSPFVGGRPHHGGWVLTLGIISLASAIIMLPAMCCCGSIFPPLAIFIVPVGCVVGIGTGLPAWIIGHKDLNAMRRGGMDASGRGLCSTGMIFGIIGTILSALTAILVVILFLVGMAGIFAAQGMQRQNF